MVIPSALVELWSGEILMLENFGGVSKEAENGARAAEAHEKESAWSSISRENFGHQDEQIKRRGEPQPVNIEKDSSTIADCLNNRDAYGAAKLLAKDLLQLKGEDYNKMLSVTQEKARAGNDGEGPPAPHLELEGWNKATGSWDKVQIETRHYPETPPIRFVQPGNSLSSIARDRLIELRDPGLLKIDFGIDHITRKLIDKWAGDIARANRVKEPNMVLDGQALRLPN